ncbi:MAG: translation initiation factor IF-2 N-terminal domain-containing protein [Selenomonadaceae bacterium]|nr:translation initiation factor IF-2 N-terminal domain-containing protein [Selenomonadaceae bacterium]
MARAKRIYELAKEFARDDKEIIEFLTAQGIRVANRLSAVSEDTYNMLKAKFTEQPKVEEPPPKVEKPVEKAAPKVDKAAQPEASPKKKKAKAPQTPDAVQSANPQIQPQPTATINAATQAIYNEAIKAGNEFIAQYSPSGTKKNPPAGTVMSANFSSYGLLLTNRFANADDSPADYWKAVNKLTTAAFKKMQHFGLAHREELAEMREAIKVIGEDYVPREIFTDEENDRFAKQQHFLFMTFGHGQGAINDQLLALKIYCERMSVKFEQMNFVEYISDPNCELNVTPRVPFDKMAEVITHSARSFPRRFFFYKKYKTIVDFALKTFFEWVDGYQKLKESGADAAKLQKYLELEEKFIYLTEFMSFDNLLHVPKKEIIPYVNAVEVLNAYRDDLDNPEAEAKFKYDLRGKVMYFLFKPKEFVFIWQLGGF